ncbi:NAD-dependent epimerase/dehydratase family protein [Vibrio breoganii]
MKILVMGGTGAMGVHLVKSLVMDSNEVYVTTRSQRHCEAGINYLLGNAKDDDFFIPLLDSSWDVIVDFMVYKTNEFEARLSKLLSSTDQYVFISSARVYADSDGPITEESPRLLDVSTDSEYLQTDEYALSKARQENLLFSSKKTNWTVVRPYITYSEQRLQLGVIEKEGWLYRLLQGRPLVFNLEMLAKTTTLTYGEDVSKAIAVLLGNPKALGEAFHVTSPKSLKWQEALDIYSEVLRKADGTNVDISMRKISEIKLWHYAHYQIDYDRMLEREFDNTKIDRFIDTKDFVSPQVGLEHCMLAFLDGKSFNLIDWRAEAIKDKQAHCKTSFFEPQGLKNKLKYLVYRYFL